MPSLSDRSEYCESSRESHRGVNIYSRASDTCRADLLLFLVRIREFMGYYPKYLRQWRDNLRFVLARHEISHELLFE